jgi:hypothetical protein
MRRRLFLIALPALFTAPSLPARAAEDTNARSCRAFVQQFYDQYLRMADLGGREAPDERIMRRHPAWFSPELRRAMAEDLAAAKRSPGEIVGLDFDPFLNAQDVAKRYTARRVSRQGGSFIVDVYASWDPKKPADVAVVPELARRGGRWTFVNFRYPAHEKGEKESNLLQVLRELRAERRKPHR